MLKDKILNHKDKAIHTFHVPQWGFDVLLRSYSLRDLVQFELDAKAAVENKDTTFFAKVAASCLCEENGELCFPDYTVLLDKDFSALQAIFNEIIRLNSLAQEQAKKN